MKILYYCPEYYCQHGGRTHAHGFFHALQHLPSVAKVVLYPTSGNQESGQRGHARTKSGRGKLWFLPEAPRKIVRFFLPKKTVTKAVIAILRSSDCDSLVIRTGNRMPDISQVKSACPDVTICLEVNSAYFDEDFKRLPLRSLFQAWEVKRFFSADAIVVVSSYLKSYLECKSVPAGKILVNQNGIDADVVASLPESNVRARYGISENAFVIGYIGGMETFRRIPEVVRHIASLRKEGDEDIVFLVVGDGSDMPAVRAAVAADKDQLEDAVILVGWQEYSDIPGFLAAFNIAIFPFTNDYCSPLKLFEYLGAGLPTLGPDTSAVREVFEDKVHLMLVKQDGSNFASAIRELKSDPVLREQLSKNGKRLVLSEYTWIKNAERVVKHIQNMRNTIQRNQG